MALGARESLAGRDSKQGTVGADEEAGDEAAEPGADDCDTSAHAVRTSGGLIGRPLALEKMAPGSQVDDYHNEENVLDSLQGKTVQSDGQQLSHSDMT